MLAHVPLALVLLLLVVAGGAAAKHHDPPFRSLLRRTRPDGSWDRTERMPLRPFVHADRPEAAATLVVSPAVVARSGDPAIVTWSGVTDAKDTDWIGLYLDDGDDHNDYVDFLYVSGSPAWSLGTGTLNTTIINMRRPAMHFRYFQYRGANAYVYIMRSNSFTFASLNEPLQGHLALTPQLDEMRVMFVTSAFDTPLVQYGLVSGRYDHEVSGTSATYTADMMCGAPANVEGPNAFIDPGVTHDVLLRGLAPATQYYYRFGTREHGFSTERSFKTAPLPGTPVTRFIAYGDMGEETPGGPTVAQRILDEATQTDYILHFGDLSYAVGRGWLWETWGSLIDPIATQTPYMVSIGNHEYCYLPPSNGRDPSGAPGNGWHPTWGNYGADSGNECAVPTYYRYHMPEGGNSLFWYSFNYGNVHILQMSTEHDFTSGSPQYTWMEADLRSVNRTETPFVVVTGHRPMYNSEMYESDYRVCQGMQEAFEDLLVENHVDVFLGGHYHSMEVTCFVYKNKCYPDDGTINTKGLYHITVGSAGAWVDTAGYYDVEWRAYAEQVYGYERVTTTANTMTFEFVRSSDNVVSHTLRVPRRFY